MKTWIVKVAMCLPAPGTHAREVLLPLKYLDATYEVEACSEVDACAKAAWVAAHQFEEFHFGVDGATAIEWDPAYGKGFADAKGGES